MTDRFNAVLVTLESEVREDDADRLLNALRMVRGVLDVRGVIGDHDLSATASALKVRHDTARELWAAGDALIDRGRTIR